jgi:hypothetical protein
MEASVRWPDETGPWLIATHWAQVEGRAMIVGLDVRSFYDKELKDGSLVRVPVGGQWAEVTQRVLRGIHISQIRDLTRAHLRRDAESALFSPAPQFVADHAQWAYERLARLTAKGEPRKRRPPAGDDLLRRVAALYEHAVENGDTKPAKYVEDQLRDAGEQRLSTKGGRVLVRQWIRRARERGYLTIPSPRSKGA